MSQSAPPSRPSKTNRADHGDRRHGPSTADSRSTPLTERSGVSLREEVRDFDDLRGDRPVSWGRAVHRWRDYIRDRRGVSTVFEDVSGNRAESSTAHRFAPEYADRQYAKLKDLERGLRREYGKRLHTAMLSLTASSTDGEGRPLPPVDHLDGLLDSWEAVRRSLSRVLDGRRWEYLAILEPHPSSGYLHVHIAVFVDGVVRSEEFAPVVEAHLRNSDLAGEEAHRVDDDSTISVNHVGRDRDAGELENLGTYLAEYLGTYGDDPIDEDEVVQMANAVLWATERRRWRPSAGAQEYMATNRGEGSSEWSLVGIRDGEGEYHDVPGGGGGVDRFTTGFDPPPS